jgi:hypothetical protein
VAKDLDPGRPVIDSDGIHMLGVSPPDPGVQFSSGVLDRGTLDYFVQFIGVSDLPMGNPRRYELAPFPVKPSIAHEDVNHFTFPRFRRLFDGYDGAVKMHWFQEAMQKLQARGLLDESEKWAESSERLYGAGAKMSIEALRLNPGWSGYHFWQIVDFWNATDGLFDIRMQRKPFPTDAEVLRWNSPVAVLQKGFPASSVLAETQADVRIFGSNFDPQDWAAGKLEWKLFSGGQTLASGDAATAVLKQGDVTLLAELKIGFPSVTKPTPVSFQVGLSTAGGKAENEWNCWIYPAAVPKASLPAPVFAEELLLPMLANVAAKPIPTGTNVLPTQAIYVTSKATPDVLAAVEGGARLLLLSPASGVPSQTRRWGGGWWDGSVAGMENGGTMTYGNTPLTRELAPDGWCDAGWYHLLDGSRTYPLETWPVNPRLLIRNIDTWQSLPISPRSVNSPWAKDAWFSAAWSSNRKSGMPPNQSPAGPGPSRVCWRPPPRRWTICRSCRGIFYSRISSACQRGRCSPVSMPRQSQVERWPRFAPGMRKASLCVSAASTPRRRPSPGARRFYRVNWMTASTSSSPEPWGLHPSRPANSCSP